MQEETFKSKLAARKERLRLKRSVMSGGSNDDSYFGGGLQHPMTSRNTLKPRGIQNEDRNRMAVLQSTSPLKKNNAYGPATSKAGYSASFVPGKSGFLFPTDMDEDDMNDISGIANDISYAENTLEISLFKNNRSIEPKQPPKYEDENFFENDNSFYAMDDQD